MRAAWLLALCLAACDDTPGGRADPPDAGPTDGAPADLDPGADAQPDGGPEPDAAPPAIPDAAAPVDPDAGPPRPAWIEVALTPRLPLYDLDDHPVLSAQAFDRVGEPLDAEFEWSVAPPGSAQLDGARALTFLGEGSGVARACVADVCGRVAFHVDAGPPVLQVTSPARGAALGADGARTIRVRGSATDTGHDVVVRVNGVRVDVGEGGAFSLDLPARFGVNRVVTTADDGVRRPPVLDARDVLWAPRYARADERGATVAAALTLRLDQAVLDADGAVELPEGEGEAHLTELAQVIEAMLALAEVDDALGDPQVADDAAFSLRVEGISLGAPAVELSFTEAGIELFLRLPQVEIEVSGQLVLEGEGIDLGGTLRAGIAAFASSRVALDDDGAFTAWVVDTGVAVESLGGAFADETAQVLVGTLGSRLRGIARDLAVDLVDGVIREQLPDVIRQAIGSLLDSVREIPLRADVGIEGAPPIDLVMHLDPSELTLRRQRTMRIDLDARVRQPMQVAAPHEDPGVPTLAPEAFADLPGEGFGAALRLALVNAILHEIWRAGVLQLTPPLPAEVAGLFGAVFVDARLPPVVAPAPAGSVSPLEVQIGDLRMVTQPPGAPNPDVYGLTLRAGMTVRTQGGRIELVVAGEPDLQAVLISKGSDRPIAAAALAALVGSIVWPLVLESVDGGLGFGIDPVALDAGALGGLAPRIAGLTLAPAFSEPPRVEAGRILLEGGMGVTVEVGP